MDKRTKHVWKDNIQSHPENKASMIGELDGSCDFSGGCTPYKDIAKNAANKQKMANDKKRRCKHKPAKSVLATTKDEGLTNNSKMQEDAAVVYNEVECGMKTCKICGETTSLIMYKEHLKDCMKKHFHRSAKSSEEGEVIFCQVQCLCCFIYL